MNNINVSVVIPYYKSSQTIDRAIDSVLNQTRLPRKIFIIDDNSSTSIDKKKLKELSNYELVEIIYLNENSGPGVARNRGIDKSNTEYIAFLDSDDAWEADKLEIQYDLMVKEKADLSGHGSYVYSKDYENVKSIGPIKSKVICPRQQLFKNQFPTRSVMIKKDIGVRFHPNKRRAEDFLFWTTAILENKKAIKINKNLCYSFKNNYGESGLTKDLKKMYLGILDSYKILNNLGLISFPLLYLLYIHQTIKHFYRILKTKFKR